MEVLHHESDELAQVTELSGDIQAQFTIQH